MRVRFRVAASVVLLLLAGLRAQEPEVLWESRFGGGGDERCAAMVACAHGGFALAGSTSSFGAGDSDVYVVKTDAQGRLVWQQTYGGGAHDEGRAIVETADGGYGVCGKTESWPRPGAWDEIADVYLVRLDGEGRVLWERTYGTAEEYEWGASLVEEPDGGFVVAGVTGPAGYLFRVDAAGELLWERTFMGAGVTLFYSVDRLPGGGYVVGGVTDVAGRNLDLLLLVTDENGNALWQRTFGGRYRDEFGFARSVADGGFIVVGSVIGDDTRHADLGLFNVDPNGDLRWSRLFGGPDQDYGFAVCETAGGGFLAGGMRDSGTPGVQAYLLATDADGDLLWEMNLGGPEYQSIFAVEELPCGDIAVAGTTGSTGATRSDVFLARLGRRQTSVSFVRGDASADGKFDIADPITVLEFLFAGATIACASACDANDDGYIDIADPIVLLGHLFAKGDPLPSPFGGCGLDPTPDALGCAAYDLCP